MYNLHLIILFHIDRGLFTAALIYVDDILVIGTSSAHIANLKLLLDQQFSIKDLVTAKYYLGLEVSRSELGLHLNQRKYVLDLRKEYQMA